MTGPYLYDDDPAPLHTGNPRRRHGLLIAIFGGTVLVALLMVGLSFLIKGSPDDQAREAAGVFLAAMDQGDTDTAYALLCEDERADLAPDEVAARYQAAGGSAEIVSVETGELRGDPAREVGVEWADGSRTRLVVVNADGPHICGVVLGD